MTTLSELAAQVAAEFTRGEREADGIGKILVRKSDLRADDWIQKLCRDAHGDMLPDDWRYEFIGDALDSISEMEDDATEDDARERFREQFDGRYVYTHEQTAWLASRADRYGYCDEAAEELYGARRSGAPLESITDRISIGMEREASEVFESVLQSLQARLEELSETEATP